MFQYITILLLCMSVSAQIRSYNRKIGAPCPVPNEFNNSTAPGVCQKLQLCQSAMQLININKVAPPFCCRENGLDVACCELHDSLSRTGDFRQLFLNATRNFIRAGNVTCYYDGQLPMVCCGDTKTSQAVEPRNCPRLARIPMINIRKRKYYEVYHKCFEYQKYYNKCVAGEDGSFVRKNTCVAPTTNVRIFGGLIAAEREFPHMAVLGTASVDSSHSDVSWIAGGALLSDKFILTAAHALSSEYDRIRYALLGTVNKTDLRSGLLFNIIQLIPHPDFDSVKQINDIALVELDRRVPFSEFIRPLCLPIPGTELNDPELVVAGWGRTENGNTSDVLLKVPVFEVSPAQCEKFNQGGRKFDSSTTICAKGKRLSHNKNANNFQDTCQGDSGSPLTTFSREFNCTYVALGVVSHGPGCGSGDPAVYTRVGAYFDWIVDTVWPGSGSSR